MTGARFEVDVQDEAVRAMLAGLDAASADMTPAFDEIGSMLVSSTIDRFERGAGPDGAPWEPSRRVLEEGGQTLILSGRLRQSVTHAAAPGSVTVGTNVIYAAIQQLGGRAGRGHAAEIPARPFLGVSSEDETEIINILRDHLAEGSHA